jgi:AraC-like DNA-binding protein
VKKLHKQPSIANAAARTLPWVGAGELRRFKASRDLHEKQLAGPIGKMLKELTDLPLHILWHEVFDSQRSGKALRLCPGSKHKGGADADTSPICEGCLERNWKPSVAPFDDGRRFVGPCGVENYRVAVKTGNNVSPLTLAIQAHLHGGSGKARDRVPEAKFEQTIALVHLIKRDLEMSLRAATAEVALERLRKRMPVIKREARLAKVLHDHDGHSRSADWLSGDNHAQRIVQSMTIYVHEHFQRPMSLSEVATTLGMNASYLSDLFSRNLGMPFHQYLVEIRMANARQLLLAPHRRICDVACAVGYSSADQFRHAFKAHAGVPPSAWR